MCHHGANAVFDATGARLVRLPTTPPRVKQALANLQAESAMADLYSSALGSDLRLGGSVLTLRRRLIPYASCARGASSSPTSSARRPMNPDSL